MHTLVRVHGRFPTSIVYKSEVEGSCASGGASGEKLPPRHRARPERRVGVQRPHHGGLAPARPESIIGKQNPQGCLIIDVDKRDGNLRRPLLVGDTPAVSSLQLC